MIELKPIGTIHTPFKKRKGMPIQPAGAAGVKGTVEVLEEYRAGLKDLDGFSHVILIYHFHMTKTYELIVKPFMDDTLRGVFATRAPTRPNPIGISIVRLKGIEGSVVHLGKIDILDGTPLLDIKPYVPEFDHHDDVKIGWLKSAKGQVQDKTSDERFK